MTSCYGSIEANENTSLLEQGKVDPSQNQRRRLSFANNNFYRYPLQTLLSVIDEDPSESDLDSSLDECEIQRRQSIQQDLRKSWRLGLFLAVLSGIFFTATSIMVQYFKVPAMEIFLVRSIFQVSFFDQIKKYLFTAQGGAISVLSWIAL